MKGRKMRTLKGGVRKMIRMKIQPKNKEDKEEGKSEKREEETRMYEN